MRSTFQSALAVAQVALLSSTIVDARRWGINLWVWGNDYGHSAYYLLGRGDGGKHPYPDDTWLKEHAYITKATTTVQVPMTPQNREDPFAIFPGLQNDWGDLVQSVIAYFPPSNSTDSAPCGAHIGWCAFANFYTQAGGQPRQYSARGATVNTGDTLTIDYEYKPDTGEYSQMITKDGQYLSALTRKPANGPIHQWSPKTECIGDVATNSPPHIYRHTRIELVEPFPQFADTAMAINTTASVPQSPDGGKSWDIQVINVQGIECKSSPTKGDTLAFIVDATTSGTTEVASKMKKRDIGPIRPRQNDRRSRIPYRARPRY